MDELLQQAVETGAVPGVAAIVTGRDGITYEGHAGTTSVDGGAPVDATTMYRIASMTKALTSVAAMQLVEQGKLELDQPVASVLPEFRKLHVLEGFEGDEPKLRPPEHPATMRHLLTHTSGCAYFFGNEDLNRYAELTGVPDLLSGVRAAIGTPLVADPGTKWEYGVSTDWLGLVVEHVTGRTLGEHLTETLFAPLGMRDTTFRPTDEHRARTMAIHARQPDGSLALSDIELPDDPECDFGGSGAYGTARDYERFVRAILRGGELDGTRILEQRTVDNMFSDHLRGAPLPQLIKSARPDLTNDIPALPFKQGWGLGFHLTLEDVPGMRREGTGDWAGLFNSYYWVDRKAGVAGLLMTQVLPFFDMGVLGTFVQLEQGAYAQTGAATPA